MNQERRLDEEGRKDEEGRGYEAGRDGGGTRKGRKNVGNYRRNGTRKGRGRDGEMWKMTSGKASRLYPRGVLSPTSRACGWGHDALKFVTSCKNQKRNERTTQLFVCLCSFSTVHLLREEMM